MLYSTIVLCAPCILTLHVAGAVAQLRVLVADRAYARARARLRRRAARFARCRQQITLYSTYCTDSTMQDFDCCQELYPAYQGRPREPIVKILRFLLSVPYQDVVCFKQRNSTSRVVLLERRIERGIEVIYSRNRN